MPILSNFGKFDVVGNTVMASDTSIDNGSATHIDVLGYGGLRSYGDTPEIVYDSSTNHIINATTTMSANRFSIGSIIYLNDNKYYKCYGYGVTNGNPLFQEINLTGDNNTLQGSSTFSAGILVTSSIQLTDDGTNTVNLTNDSDGLNVNQYINVPGINIANIYGIDQHGDATFRNLTGSNFNFNQFNGGSGNLNIGDSFSIAGDLYVGGQFTCPTYNDWVTNTISAAINAISDDIYLGNYDFNGYDFAVDGYTISTYDSTNGLTVNSHTFSGGHFKGDIFEFVEDGETSPTLYSSDGKLKTDVGIVANAINIGSYGITNVGATTIGTLIGAGFNFTNFNGTTTNITNNFKIGNNLIVIDDITASSITGSRVQATTISAIFYEGLPSFQQFDLGATFSAGILVNEDTNLVMDEGHIITKFNGNEYILNNYIYTDDGVELSYNNVVATNEGFKVGLGIGGFENCTFGVDDGGTMYVNDIYANRNNTIQRFNNVISPEAYLDNFVFYDYTMSNNANASKIITSDDDGLTRMYSNKYHFVTENGNSYGVYFDYYGDRIYLHDNYGLNLTSRTDDGNPKFIIKDYNNNTNSFQLGYVDEIHKHTMSLGFPDTSNNKILLDATTIIPDTLYVGGQIGDDDVYQKGFKIDSSSIKLNGDYNSYKTVVDLQQGGGIILNSDVANIDRLNSARIEITPSGYINSPKVTASTISGSNYELGQANETGSLNNNRIYFEGGKLYAQVFSASSYEGISLQNFEASATFSAGILLNGGQFNIYDSTNPTLTINQYGNLDANYITSSGYAYKDDSGVVVAKTELGNIIDAFDANVPNQNGFAISAWGPTQTASLYIHGPSEYAYNPYVQIGYTSEHTASVQFPNEDGCFYVQGVLKADTIEGASGGEVTLGNFAFNGDIMSHTNVNVGTIIQVDDTNVKMFVGDLECQSLKETSLREYKHAIIDVQSPQLQKIRLLRPVTFLYNTDTPENISDTSLRQAGFIAEDMELIYPEICWYTNGKLGGVQYQRLTSYLTKGIQQLDEQNTKLKQRVSSLQQRLEKLQKLLIK